MYHVNFRKKKNTVKTLENNTKLLNHIIFLTILYNSNDSWVGGRVFDKVSKTFRNNSKYCYLQTGICHRIKLKVFIQYK